MVDCCGCFAEGWQRIVDLWYGNLESCQVLDWRRECIALQIISLGNHGGLGHSLGPIGGGHRPDQVRWRNQEFGYASLPWITKGSIVDGIC